MDKQLRRFVAELMQRGHASVSMLASTLGVSERTVRNYVHRASDELSSAARIENNHGQITLDVLDREALDQLVQSTPVDRGSESQATRVSELLCNLVRRSGWVTLVELSDELYTSPRTLSDSLRDVERQLARFDLRLERRPRYGLSVTGTELSRRVCLSSVIKLGQTQPAWPELQSVMHQSEKCVRSVLEGSTLRISSVALQNLVIHVAIAVSRMREGNLVSLDDQTRTTIMSSPEYPTAEAVSKEIASEFGVVPPLDEIAYIALRLAGRCTVGELPEGDEPLISDEVWDIVERMLTSVWKTFGIDLRGDLELRMNLARHIVPLRMRLAWHMRLDNPLLQDVKDHFPLAYSMAASTAPILQGAYGSTPSDEEIGYLALAFALSLERRETQLPKKNILIVCASGQGSARLLKHRYRKEFGDYLNSIEVCDASRVSSQDFTHIDYVFTTVPLDVKVPVPVRLVQFFPDSEEIEHVRDILREGPTYTLVPQCFKRDLFFPHLSFSSKDEAIDFLCERASATGLTGPSFAERVWRREHVSATSFGNDIAMPHPIEPTGSSTFVTVGLLDAPITWDEYGHDVRVVFLVSFPKDADDTSHALIDTLTETFSDQGGLDHLMRAQTWESLLSLIKSHTV